MEMVWIEPGTFLMRTTEEQKQRLREMAMCEDWTRYEQPAHQVTIAQGFYLGKYEITQMQWGNVMEPTPWSERRRVRSAPGRPAAVWSVGSALPDCRRYAKMLAPPGSSAANANRSVDHGWNAARRPLRQIGAGIAPAPDSRTSRPLRLRHAAPPVTGDPLMLGTARKSGTALLVLVCLIATTGYVGGSPEPRVTKTLTQPDGTTFSAECFSDEFAYYVIADGGLVVQSEEDGYYYYARFHGVAHERISFRPTVYVAAVDDDSPEVLELQRRNDDAFSLAGDLLRNGTGFHESVPSAEYETLTQPDGTTFPAFCFADEFAAYLYTHGGLVVQSGEDGYYYYARFERLADGRFNFRPSDLPTTWLVCPATTTGRSSYMTRTWPL